VGECPWRPVGWEGETRELGEIVKDDAPFSPGSKKTEMAVLGSRGGKNPLSQRKTRTITPWFSGSGKTEKMTEKRVQTSRIRDKWTHTA